jgi:hypothetical protein
MVAITTLAVQLICFSSSSSTSRQHGADHVALRQQLFSARAKNCAAKDPSGRFLHIYGLSPHTPHLFPGYFPSWKNYTPYKWKTKHIFSSKARIIFRKTKEAV